MISNRGGTFSRRNVERVLVASLAVALAFASDAALGQTVQPPPPGPLRPYIFPAVEQFQLDNGLKVILVQKHTLPVVEGRLIIDAGAMREPFVRLRDEGHAEIWAGAAECVSVRGEHWRALARR